MKPAAIHARNRWPLPGRRFRDQSDLMCEMLNTAQSSASGRQALPSCLPRFDAPILGIPCTLIASSRPRAQVFKPGSSQILALQGEQPFAIASGISLYNVRSKVSSQQLLTSHICLIATTLCISSRSEPSYNCGWAAMHDAMGVLFKLHPRHVPRYLGPDNLMCICSPFGCRGLHMNPARASI